MKRRVKAVLDARCVQPTQEVMGRLRWVRTVPQMSVKSSLAKFRAVLHSHKPDLAIIDPLYLSWLAGNNKVSQSELAGTGPILGACTALCRAEGATLLALHHYNRKGQPNGVPTLRDLTGAGPAQFVRQWILLNHRQDYDFSGVHKLHMVLGGSQRSAHLHLMIDEGNRETPCWRVHLEDAKKEEIKERNLVRDNRRANLQVRVLNALALIAEKGGSDCWATKTEIREVASMNNPDAEEGLKAAVDDGDVEAACDRRRGKMTTVYRRLR
jgi:hypothetical protein